jgi:hypothetical protein
MGRPLKQITPEVEKVIYGMARNHCTDSEIGSVLDIGESALKRRYGPLLKKGRDETRERIRRKQIEIAEAGNVTMLIWLGKQLLGQSDTPAPIVVEEDEDEKPRTVITCTEAEQAAYHNKQ